MKIYPVRCFMREMTLHETTMMIPAENATQAIEIAKDLFNYDVSLYETDRYTDLERYECESVKQENY